MKRILAVGMILLIGATIAFAAVGTDTTVWNNGGSNNVCANGETLDWVLTTDGSGNTISNAVLTLVINGVPDGTFTMTQIDSSASWHVTTPYFDPSTLTGTFVTYNLLTGTNTHFNLVISSCQGPPIPELNPIILTGVGLFGLVLVSRKYKK